MSRPRIQTPQDITNLPRHVGTVDPANTPLSHILYSYDLRPFEIKCALCGKEHMDGRIVALVNGSVTNIGHICGKKFGDKYSEALLKFHEELSRPILIQKITEGLSKVDSLQLPLLTLRNEVEDLRDLHQRFGKLFQTTYQTLRRRAQDNQADIFATIERSNAEIEDLLAANPYQSRDSLRVRQEYRGTVSGYRFAAVDWSLEAGTFRLLTEADRFLEMQGQTLATKTMAKWAIWLEDFDDNIESVKSTIDEGKRFFTEANFQLFALLPATEAIQARLRTLTIHDLMRKAPAPVAPLSAHQPKVPGRVRAERPKSELTVRQLRRLLGNKKAR